MAFLSFTYGTNGIPVPSGKDYCVNLIDEDLMLKQINLAKEQNPDMICVFMHWGVEYTHEPTEYQVDAAEFLAEHDVDVIIGSHPHVIQPVAWIDDTLVFYSLGNFVSAQYQDENYNKMIGLAPRNL